MKLRPLLLTGLILALPAISARDRNAEPLPPLAAPPAKAAETRPQ